jgi:hypothetical protein
MSKLNSRDLKKQREHKNRLRLLANERQQKAEQAALEALAAEVERKMSLTDDQIYLLSYFARSALQNMLFSTSTSDDWAAVAIAINTGMVLSEMGIGPEHESLFIQAQEVLSATWERGTRLGAWRFDGKGSEIIRNAIEIHELQFEAAQVGEIREAYTEVKRREEIGNVYEIEPIAA